MHFIIIILQMKKLNLRDLKGLVQCHTIRKERLVTVSSKLT